MAILAAHQEGAAVQAHHAVGRPGARWRRARRGVAAPAARPGRAARVLAVLVHGRGSLTRPPRRPGDARPPSAGDFARPSRVNRPPGLVPGARRVGTCAVVETEPPAPAPAAPRPRGAGRPTRRAARAGGSRRPHAGSGAGPRSPSSWSARWPCSSGWWPASSTASRSTRRTTSTSARRCSRTRRSGKPSRSTSSTRSGPTATSRRRSRRRCRRPSPPWRDRPPRRSRPTPCRPPTRCSPPTRPRRPGRRPTSRRTRSCGTSSTGTARRSRSRTASWCSTCGRSPSTSPTRVGLSKEVMANLPADAGQIVIMNEDQLEAVQTAARLLDIVSFLLVIVALILFVIAIWIAPDRRIAVRNSGVAFLLVGLAALALRRYAGDAIIDSLDPTGRGPRRGRGSLEHPDRGAARRRLPRPDHGARRPWPGPRSRGPSRLAGWLRRMLRPLAARPFGWYAVAAIGLLALLAFGSSLTPARVVFSLILLATLILALETARRVALRATPRRLVRLARHGLGGRAEGARRAARAGAAEPGGVRAREGRRPRRAGRRRPARPSHRTERATRGAHARATPPRTLSVNLSAPAAVVRRPTRAHPPAAVAPTKLVPPAEPAGFVPRPRLHALLAEATRQRVTVVSSHAGTGKSVLLAAYCRTLRPGRVAWVGLDREDDWAPRLWALVDAALRGPARRTAARAARRRPRGRHPLAPAVRRRAAAARSSTTSTSCAARRAGAARVAAGPRARRAARGARGARRPGPAAAAAAAGRRPRGDPRRRPRLHRARVREPAGHGGRAPRRRRARGARAAHGGLGGGRAPGRAVAARRARPRAPRAPLRRRRRGRHGLPAERDPRPPAARPRRLPAAHVGARRGDAGARRRADRPHRRRSRAGPAPGRELPALPPRERRPRLPLPHAAARVPARAAGVRAPRRAPGAAPDERALAPRARLAGDGLRARAAGAATGSWRRRSTARRGTCCACAAAPRAGRPPARPRPSRRARPLALRAADLAAASGSAPEAERLVARAEALLDGQAAPGTIRAASSRPSRGWSARDGAATTPRCSRSRRACWPCRRCSPTTRRAPASCRRSRSPTSAARRRRSAATTRRRRTCAWRSRARWRRTSTPSSCRPGAASRWSTRRAAAAQRGPRGLERGRVRREPRLGERGRHRRGRGGAGLGPLPVGRARGGGGARRGGDAARRPGRPTRRATRSPRWCYAALGDADAALAAPTPRAPRRRSARTRS